MHKGLNIRGLVCFVCLVVVFGVSVPWRTGHAAEAAKTLAFIDVSVVSMKNDQVLEGQTVIVRDGRIAAIGAAAETIVPADALPIDGHGKYLMPGLADMHVHVWNTEDFLLYLANGVTTVRNMWGTPLQLGWREKIAAGDMDGPTLYTTSPLLDGKDPIWDGSTVVETVAQAEELVQEYKQAGYDFIKVYNRLSKDVYEALVAAAKRHAIPVVGHVPDAVGLERVLQSGQVSIEHLIGYTEALEAEDSPVRGKWDWPSRRKAINFIDETRIEKVAAATRDAGVWSCVTLVVFQKMVDAEQARAIHQRPEMQYVPPLTRADWGPPKDIQGPEDWASLRKADEVRLRLTRALHQAGARILLGTDTPNSYVVPGFSIHEELHNLVEAGMTPYEAIKAGTRDAAEFLGALDEFGTVAVGRRADLILVNANPLEDVAHVARRSGVMVRGEWLPESVLQQQLDAQVAAYSVPKDRFANLPGLPSEGESVFSGRYAITWNDAPFGEERMALEHLPDGRQLIVAQGVYGTYHNVLRMELDSEKIIQRVVYDGGGALGQGQVSLQRAEDKLQIAGQLPPYPALDLEQDIEPKAFILVPMLAPVLPIEQAMRPLAIGQTTQVIVKELEVNQMLAVFDTTVSVERLPDVQADMPWGPVSARVYRSELSNANETYFSTMMADAQGRPLRVEVERKMGRFVYERIQE